MKSKIRHGKDASNVQHDSFHPDGDPSDSRAAPSGAVPGNAADPFPAYFSITR